MAISLIVLQMPLTAPERARLMKSGKSQRGTVSIKLTERQVERLGLLLKDAEETNKFPHPQDADLREMISNAARYFWART